MIKPLPACWSQSAIGDIATYIQRGKSPKYTERSDLPVINQKAIRWHALEEQHFKYVHPDQWSAWDNSRYIVTGDILWNSTGTGTVGRAYLVKETDAFPRKVVDSHVTIVRSSKIVDTRFLFYWIKGPIVQQKIEEMCDGTTNQIELNRASIAATQIPLAPLSEQKRIADKLDAVLARVDACRERLDRIPQLLKRFRQSVLAAATSGKLTDDWRIANNHTFNWQELRLGDIADIQGGITKDSKKQSIQDEEVPYLRVANVQRGYIDLSEIKRIRVPANRLDGLLLEPGDILFNEGGDLDKLGRGWIWEGQIQRCSFQNHVFRARLFDSSNQPKYISWWGNCRGLDYFISSGKQTTNLASINKTMLSNLPISLPSALEQTEIVRRVETLFAFAERLEARYNTARAQVEKLTPALLAKAFRGELVPQDPNDEPASVLLERIYSSRTSEKTTKAKRGAGKSSTAARTMIQR